MAKRLTEKQTKFTDEFIKNGQNGTQAVLKAYDTDDEQSAASLAYKNLNNPKIAEAIKNALSKKGITTEKIAEIISDGLEATKSVTDQKAGTINDSDIPDHLVRHKFLSTVIEITGAKAPTKHEHNFRGVLAVDKLSEINARIFGAKA